MALINRLKTFNKKYLLLILFLSLTIIIYELFLSQFLAGKYLFYTGKANMVIDGTAYEVNDNFSVYQSKADFAGIIGKQSNLPKLYVSHVLDEYFIKLKEAKHIIPIHNGRCHFFVWNNAPAWRDVETKLTFTTIETETENENVLEVYREFGCSIAKAIK